jgi:hypothetical protein
MQKIKRILLVLLFLVTVLTVGYLCFQVKQLKDEVRTQVEVLNIYYDVLKRHSFIMEEIIHSINLKLTENNYGQGMRTTQGS